jgi:NTP pyrophosphatase (non-canonical NTP hydrolase)
VNTLTPEYSALVIEVARHFTDRDVTSTTQLLKLQEEVGEAAAGWIGFLGLNPRKGVTHTLEDVAMELADVVITALVGIHMLGFTPEYILAKQAIKVEERLNDAT